MARSRTMSKLERGSGWVLLLNGGLGLAVATASALARGGMGQSLQSVPWVSLLGMVAGLLALRSARAGLMGGLLFYGLQIASYYSHNFQFNFKSGLSLGAVIELPQGVLVVNVAALAGLAVILLILLRRRPLACVKALS